MIFPESRLSCYIFDIGTTYILNKEIFAEMSIQMKN